MRLVPIVASVVVLANWRGRSPRPSWKERTLMKRILLLVTLAAMLAAALALSGVAQAKPTATSADRQCMKLAIQTLPNFKPAHYTFHGGTDDIMVVADFTGQGTEEGNDVFCGFGGQN